MTTAVARAEDALALKSEDWLLGYECCRNGLTNDKYFQAEKHWAELLRLGIPFFKSSPPPASSSAISPGATATPADEGEILDPVAASTPSVTTGDTEYEADQTGGEGEEDGDDEEDWEDDDEDEDDYYE